MYIGKILLIFILIFCLIFLPSCGSSYENGYSDGHTSGYEEGYEAGYEEAKQVLSEELKEEIAVWMEDKERDLYRDIEEEYGISPEYVVSEYENYLSGENLGDDFIYNAIVALERYALDLRELIYDLNDDFEYFG